MFERELKNLTCYPIRTMSRSNGIGIIIWIYLITNGDIIRCQTEGPNAVALINGETMLDCITNKLAGSNWQRTLDGISNPITIASGCNITGDNAAHYRTEQPGGNVCRLIIANVTMQQAGVYTCYNGFTKTYFSLVTVIEHVASVAVYNQSGVVDGDRLNISCSINYTGPAFPAPSLRPSPYWTTSPGQIYTSATYHPSTNVVTLIVTVTVQKPTVPIFQCKTVFEITGTTIGYNATAPADSFTVGNTTVLDVQFSPSTPSVTSRTEVITENGVECEVSVLTCNNSTGNPPPQYMWFDTKQSLRDAVLSEELILQLTDINRNYTCEAYNWMRSARYSNSTTYKVPATENSTNNSYCILDNSPSSPTYDLLTAIIPAAVLGGYGLCNIIATILFLVYYNRNWDDKEMSTLKNKSKLNARFPWLQRMLPCMNESRENAGCTFLWVILFILMSILTGIIVFPILVAMVNCSRKHKNSKENSDIGMSNQQRSKTAGTPSTAAHGDFEDPYDEIKTIRHDRKQTLEEPTSAKNTKDAKKVFYTRVNPNLNTEEDIERYSVTMPRGSPES